MYIFRPHITRIRPCVFDKRRDNCCSHEWLIWQIFMADETDRTHTRARTHAVAALLHTFLDLTSKQTLLTPLKRNSFTNRRWKSDRWPMFVQVYRSNDMVVVHK